MKQDVKQDRRFATTLARGLSILRAFRPEDVMLGNRVLAQRTGLPPSTVSRLTFTLVQLGFLTHIESQERYRLGPAVTALGYTARASFSFLESAEPMMSALADEVGGLVALAMRDGDAMMLTRCWRPKNTASIWLSEGHRLPLALTSPGRVVLAAYPKIKSLAHPDYDIKADRAQLRAQGFIASIGEWNSRINACSTPFRPDGFAEPVAFLCGALAETIPEASLLNKVGPKLYERVRQLERSLGLPPAF